MVKCIRHPDSLRKIIKRKRRKHNEEICVKCSYERTRRWYKRHKFRIAVNNAKLRLSNNFGIDEIFIKNLYEKQKGICALSKLIMSVEDASIDRIDSLKFYTRDNVQLILYDINIMKRHHPQDKFINYCKEIARNN